MYRRLRNFGFKPRKNTEMIYTNSPFLILGIIKVFVYEKPAFRFRMYDGASRPW